MRGTLFIFLKFFGVSIVTDQDVVCLNPICNLNLVTRYILVVVSAHIYSSFDPDMVYFSPPISLLLIHMYFCLVFVSVFTQLIACDHCEANIFCGFVFQVFWSRFPILFVVLAVNITVLELKKNNSFL